MDSQKKPSILEYIVVGLLVMAAVIVNLFSGEEDQENADAEPEPETTSETESV